MSCSPETRYSFRFAPRDDATVDVWLVLSFEDPSGGAPIGWLAATSTVELGPVRLSDSEATNALRQLELAIELIAEVNNKPRKESHAQRDVPRADAAASEPGTLGRPSELRLRR